MSIELFVTYSLIFEVADDEDCVMHITKKSQLLLLEDCFVWRADIA